MAFGFLKKIAKFAGKVAIAPGKLAAGAVGKIPVIGKPLKSIVNLGNSPLNLVNSVVQGERIDRAVLNNLKSQVKDVKDVAPYAKLVVSLVPGVGTAVGAAIAAGGALIEGQSITASLIAGVKGAIPGGAAAQMAFSVSADVVSGKPVATSVFNAIPLDAAQKQALRVTTIMAKDLASGKSINKTVLAAAQSKLPPDIQKAVNVGIALGFGQTHQKKAIIPASKGIPTRKPVAASGIKAPIRVGNKLAPPVVQQMFAKPATVAIIATPAAQQMFATPAASVTSVVPADEMLIEGKSIIESNSVLKAGLSTMKTDTDKQGYYTAIGMMNHQATEADISKFQSTLDKSQSNGFNIGCAAIVGLHEIKLTGNDLADFGSAVAYGLNGATQDLKVAAIQTIAAVPEVKTAILTVAATKKAGWLHRVLVKLGFVKEVA